MLFNRIKSLSFLLVNLLIIDFVNGRKPASFRIGKSNLEYEFEFDLNSLNLS